MKTENDLSNGEKKMRTEELDNISLANSHDNQTDKKKYIILAISLISLFLIIIIITKFTSGSEDEPKLLVDEEKIVSNIEETIDVQKRYEEIMNENAQALKEDEQDETTDETAEETPTISITQDNQTEVITVKTIPKTIKNDNTNQQKKIYIQLGAFLKYPNKKYLNNLTQKDFQYKVIKVEVKGKVYNKLLIGPYSNIKQARDNLPRIKKDLNSPGSFIYNN